MSLGLGEGALKCHVRNSDDGAPIKLWSSSSAVWVLYPSSIIVVFQRWSSSKNGLATAAISFEAPPPGDAVVGLYTYVGPAGAAVDTRWKSTICRHSRGHRHNSNSLQVVAARTLDQCEHTTSIGDELLKFSPIK